jgi:hypothetical protein
MSEFVKDRNNKDSIRKSEIIRARYALTKGNRATLIFTLRNNEEINWFDYFESEAILVIESL